MAELAADPDLEVLMDSTIEEAEGRFGVLQAKCKQYITDAVLPGTNVIRMIDA